jgi:hypothetical protein
MRRVLPGMSVAAVLLGATVALYGCGPKEGSSKWCDAMMNKPRGQWTPHQQQVYDDKCATNQIQKQIDKLIKH